MEDRTQLGRSLTGESDCTAAQAEGLPNFRRRTLSEYRARKADSNENEP
jgi:hypothetical protein